MADRGALRRDFDSRFRLKRDRPRERLLATQRAMEQGRPLPPVDLYRIKDQYFVVDGNHRIAAAKALGFREINARVVEFLPAADSAEDALYRERSDLLELTGLPDSLFVTEPGQYAHLVGQIACHRSYLESESGDAVTLPEAAADWHESIYRPLERMIETAGLLESFPGRTTADLYAHVTSHRWERDHLCSCGSAIEGEMSRNMEEFRATMKSMKEGAYPEMLREITVFVLMNIAARREAQILDRLFALEEVREVHSVHGSIDVIVKVALTRDLVSSDAEVISRYVQEKIRRIPGVVSTQTLIPGISRSKADMK